VKDLVTPFALCLIFQSCIFAQVPEIHWQKALGGSGYDASYSICEDIGGGFIVTGDTWSNDGDVTEYAGSGDIWVAKLDSIGEIEWEESYGGSGWEQAFQIKQTQDLGFIIVGFSTSTDGDLSENNGADDVWIIKLDSIGNIQWQKSYGGTSSDRGNSVTIIDDGGYLITGLSSSNNGDVSGNHGEADYWILKINSDGDLVWQKCYGGTEDDQAQSAIKTLDGGFLIVGHSSSNNGDVFGNHGLGDFWVIKITEDGVLQWQKAYGGTNYEDAFSVSNTADSGYIILGYTQSNNGDISGFHGGVSDYWVIKIDSLGVLMWQKCLGGSSSEEGFSIYRAIDTSYILAGHSGSNDGNVTGHHGLAGYSDYWIVNIDSNGNIIWEKSLGGSNTDEALSITQASDEGYIVTGWARSTDGDVTDHNGIGNNWDFWVVKLAASCTPTLFYADSDEDGYGDLLNDSLSCNLPIGYVGDSSDCNDDDPFTYPSAEDICNTNDDNCNGLIDEDAIFVTYFADVDGDDFGDTFNDSIACFELEGYVINSEDCNDLNVEISPAASEICNDIDDNCDFDIDEGLTTYTLYKDEDGDSFGNSDIFINSCLAVFIGYVSDSTDCDDANNLIYPGAIEICDYLDNDCDGFVDDNLTYIHSFEDADGDDFGNINVDSLSCSIPDGFVEDDADCDDTNPNIYPGADEILNGLDDDCNLLIDEGLSVSESILNTLKIYPNPTDNILYVEYTGFDGSIIEVINIAGQILWTQTIVSSLIQIDVRTFTSGIYLLKVKTTDGEASLKFIKE